MNNKTKEAIDSNKECKEIQIKKNNKKGITLIALVVTIIILLILAGVSITAVFGSNGLIVQAQLASFASEMQTIKDNVHMKQAQSVLSALGNTSNIFTERFNENSVDILDTLKKEILYIRAGMPEESEPNDYDVEEFSSLLDTDGNVDGIYIVDKDTGNGKENTYVYDEKTDTVFKIPQTRIGGKVYHSYECATAGKGGTGGESSSGKSVDKESEVVQVGEEYYYAPNLKGFSTTQTYLVYYSEDLEEEKDVPVTEYIEGGEKPQITEGGKTYTLHNYGAESKIWANVKTIGFNQESWWVWVPRYAYKVNAKPTSSSSPAGIDIIYIGIDNKPLNPIYNGVLPEGYEPHPAFSVEGKEELKGIWMSKFEPSYGLPKSNELAPDMTGFDANNTYIELYDASSDEFIDEVKLANANLSTINNENKWYDYEKKIWANIKTVGDGQVSWWVWVPRYAYNVRGENVIDIIYVDLNNKPLNPEYNGKLPADYEVHPTFNQDGKKLKGIWMSKYEPSFGDSTFEGNTGAVLPPNMEGFDPENTYIEIYDKGTDEFIDEIKLADALVQDPKLENINNTKQWYDYPNKVWANIKTVGKDEQGSEQIAWWVWVPRYAYNTMSGGSSNSVDIIYVDLNDKPIDSKYGTELQEGFEVHPAFTTSDGKQLQGIWMSKYEPSKSANTPSNYP